MARGGHWLEVRADAAGLIVWLLPIAAIGIIYFSPKHVVSVTTAVTGLLGLALVLAAARRPDRSLIALIVLLPFQSFLLAKLWAWGMPTSIVRHLAAWKEALALGVILAGARNFLATGRRADALDRVALAFVALVALYLLAQTTIAPGAPAALSTRLLGFRQDAGFVLLLLGARHASLPDGFLNRAGRAVLAVATVVAGVCVFETLDSSGWNQFVVNGIGYTNYQAGILHSPPPNFYDIRVYGGIGGTQVVRAGSVFANPLDTGFYLVLGFAVAFERAVRRQASPWVTLSLIVIGAGVLLTQTRSAILAALVVTFVAFQPAAGRGRHWRTQLTILIAGLALLAVPAALATGLVRRVTSSTASNVDTSGHLSGFYNGLQTIRHHPLGLGLGTSAGVGQRTGSAGTVIPENGYLQVGIELGLAALILFAALTGLVFLRLRGAARASPHAVIAGVWAAIAGLAVATWFLQTWIEFAVSWTVWGLAGAALGSLRAGAEARAPADRPAGAPALLGEATDQPAVA